MVLNKIARYNEILYAIITTAHEITTRTETPLQFIDRHYSPRGTIDDHGTPMAPIRGQ